VVDLSSLGNTNATTTTTVSWAEVVPADKAWKQRVGVSVVVVVEVTGETNGEVGFKHPE